MPRSSGGGSHRSGGSHSHHSGGGSHRSGGGGSSRRSSSTNFSGATRYVYYRKHKPVYFYANYDPTKKPSPWRFLLLLFYVPFFYAGFMILFLAVHHPVKMPLDYDTQIVISDKAEVINNRAALQSSLEAFRDETGITPAVMTIYNEDWEGYYDSLESYSYDLYVNQFYDEKHWLIVYSQPAVPDEKFVDWYWEGMQGDSTIQILTNGVCNRFNEELQKKFTASSRYTVGEAIGESFDNLTPVVMKTTVEWPFIGFGVFWLLFSGLHAALMLGVSPKRARESKAVACPEGAKEDTCDYCGGIYIVGTCLTCPHCNAPLKVHNPYEPGTGDYHTGGTIQLNGEQYKL